MYFFTSILILICRFEVCFEEVFLFNIVLPENWGVLNMIDNDFELIFVSKKWASFC